MLEADENNDAEAFADKVFQFDQMSKLDKWKTTMLLRVKSSKTTLPNPLDANG